MEFVLGTIGPRRGGIHGAGDGDRTRDIQLGKLQQTFRNLPNVTVRTAPSNNKEEKAQAFSARDVLVAHKILIAKDALAKMEEVWAK